MNMRLSIPSSSSSTATSWNPNSFITSSDQPLPSSSISLQEEKTKGNDNEQQQLITKENIQPSSSSISSIGGGGGGGQSSSSSSVQITCKSVFKDRPYLKEKKQKVIGVREKMGLFDLYPPSLTKDNLLASMMDKKLISEDMMTFSRPINTQRFLLSKRSFPILRQNPQSNNNKDVNVKGGGFTERPPLSPTTRSEQQIYNQQIISTTTTTIVDPSAGMDVLPKSIQAPFSKEYGALSARLHIPQLPLDTIDMLSTDSFGNSLNSVRVNWVKSEEDLTRSVTLTSRSDAPPSVFTTTRPSGGYSSRVASAGASSTRRYNQAAGLKSVIVPSSTKSLPSTARKKDRNFMEENSNDCFTSNIEVEQEFDSETEQLIYDSLRTSYYLNVKDEKAKRKGQETITIEEHVKVTNDIIFKVTSSFKDKISKIRNGMRKEIEKIMKKYSNEINDAKEDRSDSIVNNFMKDKQIRKQLEKLKEQLAELRDKYADSSNLLNEMSGYKERYESMRKEMEKMENGRPAKSAEQNLSKLMSNDDLKMSSKEKQDLMGDFIKNFFNEDGTLNEKALFDMFMVNKELHENLSRTRDTVSFVSMIWNLLFI